ncbi:NAD(P)/FAD-dependent oxidoreductase [Acuticoccus sp.]|uniref:NAD(P)/FAD-dependent oxidoreductase n=1 Tax=Acuticoccus sp. TaxID=1904378 RepID=UPI003B52B37E
MRSDVLVLGAGMVGISTALHLLERGRSVTLVDRGLPAGETSFGNSGLIQSEAVIPYTFPRNVGVLLSAALGRRIDARLRWASLPAIAPWLLAYARASSPEAVRRTALANVPLIARARAEHERLMDRAGARHLLREGGYLRVNRSALALEEAAAVAARVRDEFGIAFDAWDADRLRAEEPHLSPALAGAIHMPEPARVEDPGDVGTAYARLFEGEGGTLVRGDATTLSQPDGSWSVETEQGTAAAREVVVALGPWSGDLLRRLGVSVPLGVKRGYHRHFRAAGNATLGRFVVDDDHGLVLTPNKRGIRLTTGAEFATRDAPPTVRQIDAAEGVARGLFPLADRLEPRAWLGARPCLPDMLPAVGPVPGRPGLWANFGHHHLGFTLGPTTGRLLAERMTDGEPFTDPAPYELARFGGSGGGGRTYHRAPRNG